MLTLLCSEIRCTGHIIMSKIRISRENNAWLHIFIKKAFRIIKTIIKKSSGIVYLSVSHANCAIALMVNKSLLVSALTPLTLVSFFRLH